MLVGSTATRSALALLGLSLSLACNSKKEAADDVTRPVQPPATDAQPETSTLATAVPDAGAPPRNWLCSVLNKVPSGGRFGVTSIKKRHPKHAGVKALLLRAQANDELHLAVLVEDDAENDRGLSINELSPARSVQAYRFLDGNWEDLGRPFQLIGWDVTLEGVVSDGPPAYAVSTGIGDVRRAMVASCESGNWTKQARFLGKSFEAAALIAGAEPAAIENASILRGVYSDIGKDCKPATRFGGGGKVPVWLEAPTSLAGDSKNASVAFAEPGECRLPRKFTADQRDDSLVVSYEQCGAIDGGDYLQIAGCQLSTLWFSGGAWKRLPPFTKLMGDVGETRAAVSLGAAGPLVAVSGPDGLTLHQADDANWSALPALPGGKACQIPIALRSDPARIVVRSCSGYGRVSAYRLDAGAWKSVGGRFDLKPKWGAQQRPSVAADWVGEVPYLAVGYYGAPVAQVFEGAGAKWKQILQTAIDPTRAKAEAK